MKNKILDTMMKTKSQNMMMNKKKMSQKMKTRRNKIMMKKKKMSQKTKRRKRKKIIMVVNLTSTNLTAMEMKVLVNQKHRRAMETKRMKVVNASITVICLKKNQ